MIGTKTRIWRGGMSEIMRPAGEGQAGAEAAPVAPEPVATPPEAAPPSARAGVQTQVLSLRKPRVGSGTLVGHVFDLSALSDELSSEPSVRKASPMTTTRLVPIEELLVERARLEPAPREASESRPRASGGASSDAGVERALGLSPRRLNGAHVRRGLIGVLGVLTVWVFANRQPGDVTVGAPQEPALVQPAALPAPVEGPTQPRHEPTPAADPSRPASAAAPAGRQRAAVDALVAGDFASARRIYGELATSTEVSDPRVFAEAARILDERMHGSRN